MIAPVHIKAQLGPVPEKFITNQNESINKGWVEFKGQLK